MHDWLLSNWPLKLLAVALAFAIWVSVTGEDRVLDDHTLPLEIELGESQVLASPVPNTVSVRLRGPASLMRRLDSVRFAARVDLSERPPGNHDVPLSKNDVVSVPRGVEVVYIDPDRLEIKLEPLAEQNVGVKVAYLGQPPDGYHFYGEEVNPSALRVSGPESAMELLDLLDTTPIRLDGRTAPFEEIVRTVPDTEYVQVREPRTLRVRVYVDASPSVRRLEGIPIQPLGSVEGLRVSPAQLDVTLSGPPALLDRILAEQVLVVADAGGLEVPTGSSTVEPRAELLDFPASDPRVTIKELSVRQVSLTVDETEN